MKRSREFNNILDECLESLLTEGATIEQCLQRFPEHADELKPLLETALATSKQVSAIQPSPEFRERARYQFYSALREMEHKKSRPFFSWGLSPRWATVLAIVLALFIAGGGTVAAASGSMPDDFLYPVKLATEKVQLAFTFSSLGKAELHAELADKRVAEIIYLAHESKPKPEKIEAVAESLNNNLTEIAVLSSTTEEPASVAVTMETEEAVIEEEAEAVEEEAVIEEAEAVAGELALREALVVEEEPAPAIAVAPLLAEPAEVGEEAEGKANRRAKLKETVESQAKNNNRRLRDLLETAPESTKSALKKAVDVSEKGYEKALKSLK